MRGMGGRWRKSRPKIMRGGYEWWDAREMRGQVCAATPYKVWMSAVILTESQ